MFGPALRIGLVLIFFFSLGSGVHFHRAGLETGFFLEDCFEIPCFHSQWRVRLKMRLRKTGGPLFCCCCCFCLYAEERNRHPPRGEKEQQQQQQKPQQLRCVHHRTAFSEMLRRGKHVTDRAPGGIRCITGRAQGQFTPQCLASCCEMC